MPVIKREFTKPFNRKESDESRRMRAEMEAMGIEPPTPPPVPAPSSKASRPDLYPAFARGVNSATSAKVVPSWDGDVGGTNMDDVNNHPDDKVATSGADRNQTDFPRKGEVDRPRNRR